MGRRGDGRWGDRGDVSTTYNSRGFGAIIDFSPSPFPPPSPRLPFRSSYHFTLPSLEVSISAD